MNNIEVKNLKEVLKLDPDRIITAVKKEPLIAKGENYGSVVLKLDITVRDQKRNVDEEIYCVAKFIPEPEFLQKLFDVQNTVRKEIAFYTKILPSLQIFQNENEMEELMDFFPTFRGGRLNLTGSETVDNDSVVILENLVKSGFKNISRFTGYNLTTAKLVLKNLAAFHSIPLAMKLKKPEDFEKHIKNNCGKFRPCPPPPRIEGNEESGEDLYYRILYESDKCLPYINKIKKLLIVSESEFVAREPFATLAHGDFWVNNQLIKLDNDKPVRCKFVDFQVYTYGSPTNDLFFFLWTSIQLEVLKEHLDDLIQYYYDNFVDNLKKLHCDTKEFEFENFMFEFSNSARDDFSHTLFMIFFIIFGKTKDVLPNFDLKTKDIPLEIKERVWFMVQECGKRHWI